MTTVLERYRVQELRQAVVPLTRAPDPVTLPVWSAIKKAKPQALALVKSAGPRRRPENESFGWE
jgi:hypothetical protein